MDDATGAPQTGVRKLQQRRYAVSAEYIVNDWTFRSEYAHSTGEAFAKSLVNTNDAAAKDCNIGSNGSKAQGVYALVIAPIVKENCMEKHVTICTNLQRAQKTTTHYTKLV